MCYFRIYFVPIWLYNLILYKNIFLVLVGSVTTALPFSARTALVSILSVVQHFHSIWSTFVEATCSSVSKSPAFRLDGSVVDCVVDLILSISYGYAFWWPGWFDESPMTFALSVESIAKYVLSPRTLFSSLIILLCGILCRFAENYGITHLLTCCTYPLQSSCIHNRIIHYYQDLVDLDLILPVD